MGGSAADHQGIPTETERRDIGKVVTGIRQQRQAAAIPAGGSFDDDKGQGEPGSKR